MTALFASTKEFVPPKTQEQAEAEPSPSAPSATGNLRRTVDEKQLQVRLTQNHDIYDKFLASYLQNYVHQPYEQILVNLRRLSKT